jgi:hypothetical protein
MTPSLADPGAGRSRTGLSVVRARTRVKSAILPKAPLVAGADDGFYVLARSDVVSRSEIDVDEPRDAELLGNDLAKAGA